MASSPYGILQDQKLDRVVSINSRHEYRDWTRENIPQLPSDDSSSDTASSRLSTAEGGSREPSRRGSGSGTDPLRPSSRPTSRPTSRGVVNAISKGFSRILDPVVDLVLAGEDVIRDLDGKPRNELRTKHIRDPKKYAQHKMRMKAQKEAGKKKKVDLMPRVSSQPVTSLREKHNNALAAAWGDGPLWDGPADTTPRATTDHPGLSFFPGADPFGNTGFNDLRSSRVSLNEVRIEDL
mmetsp:Transcript_18396/g.22086  ORF Transcript_18396/g.22086 Transcript_18396/m.22086 type:complete len:237 (-) Transcript_18396:608-1318(-)|eukprot:CAMPEP_0197844146 /NCGR_PEP_ID=MMETSP1438-20131217/1131_1 /TAXON_ID=1461541 /ORGANISM="Pterosperma sp., Strain CCMP1384" /LENGTH=236 /DNA_ID=CAMNT_0043454769 /DNA_START=458 /DNA_END=1168 /DNA_ORIENTATION=-